jgi:small subunit ribosomal protein S21
MPRIIVDSFKPFDVTLRYFKRACEKAGIVREIRDRQHYTKPTEVRKIAKRIAAKKAKKASKMASLTYNQRNRKSRSNKNKTFKKRYSS